MKKVLQLLNTLDKVEPITLDHKSIKNAGLNEMIKTAKLFYPELTIIYKPGKGFLSELQKINQ